MVAVGASHSGLRRLVQPGVLCLGLEIVVVSLVFVVVGFASFGGDCLDVGVESFASVLWRVVLISIIVATVIVSSFLLVRLLITS